MTVYEKRTYTVTVGRMADVVRLYSEEGWPVLDAGGFGEKLVGYFLSDTGPLHQLIHIWRFEDDADRRNFWKRLFADENFLKFAVQIRPLIKTQEVQLMLSAPWGPNP
jgi:hypothetical protein